MGDDIGGLFLSIGILILLVLTNAFFAMSELAIISTNEKKIHKMAEQGDKKAAHLTKIISSQSEFLATIQVGVTLSGFLSSAVAAEKFAGMLTDALQFLPVSSGVINGVSIVVITIILSYFTLIFGELVPKRFAMKNAEKISLSVSGILWGFYRISKPFVRLLAASTNGVLKLMGMSAEDEEEAVTEEDILMLVDAGEETGALKESERQMIENILKFDDRDVCEVMTPRRDMGMLPDTATVAEALALASEEGYSRIPVYEEDFDHISGVVFVKDLAGAALRQEGEQPLKDYLRKLLFVPESKLCRSLLIEFQEQKCHMAIVVDEYGGTCGLVTMEDLLESIVGDISDETDKEMTEEIQTLPDGCYLIQGDAAVEDVLDLLAERLPEEDGESETIAGWVLEQLGSIPKEDEKPELPFGARHKITVKNANGRRIEEVMVSLM